LRRGSRTRAALLARLSNEGVPDDEFWKATEIPVCRPQFPYAVQAKCRDSSVVYLGAPHPTVLERGAKLRPIAVHFRQERQARGFAPCFDLVNGLGEGSRRIVNPRVGHDGQKLV
jgi:hypothetical protein